MIWISDTPPTQGQTWEKRHGNRRVEITAVDDVYVHVTTIATGRASRVLLWRFVADYRPAPAVTPPVEPGPVT